MTYGTTITDHDLGRWGTIKFAQWDHPNEGRKEFSEEYIDWLAQFIKPGDTAIDIGAFTGDTALPMAIAAGPAGTVYAFEPNPASLEVLLKNATLNNHIAPIIVCPYAIGVTGGDAVFRYHCEQINGGFLMQGDPVTVKRVRLDECEINASRVAFVKFDCEKEDGALLAEFTPWLSKHRAVVKVERFPGLDDNERRVFWNAVFNYGTAFIDGDWTTTPLTEIPEGLTNIVIKPNA